MLKLLEETRSHLPESWREVAVKLYRRETLENLAGRFCEYGKKDPPTGRPKPHFSVEETPPLPEIFAPLASHVQAVQSGSDPAKVAPGLAKALEQIGVKGLLALLGMRQTSASLLDHRGFPPSRQALLDSAMAVYKGRLSHAARALSKHAPRSNESYWGEVKGSEGAKNELARGLITDILDHTTWWNVFGHYKHETVYEARRPTGHGVRWGHDGSEFIGFLEPFDETYRWDE